MPDSITLQPVFETADYVINAVAEGRLRESGIPFISRTLNDVSANAGFALGLFQGAAVYQIRVDSRDTAEALAALAALNESLSVSAENSSDVLEPRPEAETETPGGRKSRLSRRGFATYYVALLLLFAAAAIYYYLKQLLHFFGL